MSGDARRALEICRRAAEFADYRVKQSAQSTVSANKGTVCICVGINYSRKKCVHWIKSHINLDHQYKSTIRVMVLRLSPSIVWVKFQLAYNPLNTNPILVGDGVVSMGDIEAAIQEVFQAPHIQVS